MSVVLKKIAILLPSLKFGGGERVSLNLAAAMKELGISVDILVMSKEGEFLAEAQKNFNVYDLRCDKTYKLPFRLFQYAFLNSPQALISNFWKLNLCACSMRLFFPYLKLILWEHSPPSKTSFSPTWLYALSATLLYQLSTKIVAVSDGVQDDIKRCTLGLSRKLITIYNPIAPPKVDPLKRSTSRIDKTPLIVSVGRLEPEKNPELLIEAFALIVEKNINARLLFVGEGSLRKELEQLCLDLNIEKHVKFLGFSPNPYDILINSDLFVMSSNWEGLPTVIIEALYCGLPVVSTDCPSGPRELLVNGEYGSLVPMNDKFAFALAIEDELKKNRLPEVQKAAALRFLPSVVVRKFIDLLK